MWSLFPLVGSKDQVVFVDEAETLRVDDLTVSRLQDEVENALNELIREGKAEIYSFGSSLDEVSFDARYQ